MQTFFARYIKHKEWQRLMRIASGSAILTSANMLNAIMTLMTIPLLTRGVGMNGYGIIVIIQAFALIVTRFFDMQPWQVYIRMMGLAYDKSQAIRVGLWLDAWMLCGLLLAAGMAGLFMEIWQHQLLASDIAALFALSILNQCAFSWLGVLRLEGKFTTLAMINVLPSILRLLLLLVLSITMESLSLRTVAWVFALTEVFRLGYTVFCGWRVLGKTVTDGAMQKYKKIEKDVKGFALWNWLMNLVDLPVQYLDSLLVGRFLSLDSAGIYGIIKKLAAVGSQLATPLYQVIFPEFTRLIAQKAYFICRQLLWRSVGIMLGIGLISLLLLFVLREIWMPLFSLPLQYVSVVFLFMAIQMVAVAFTAIHPFMNALGLVRAGFFIILVSNIVFLLALYFLGLHYALLGVVMASAIQFALVIGIKTYWIGKYMRLQERHA